MSPGFLINYFFSLIFAGMREYIDCAARPVTLLGIERSDFEIYQAQIGKKGGIYCHQSWTFTGVRETGDYFKGIFFGSNIQHERMFKKPPCFSVNNITFIAAVFVLIGTINGLIIVKNLRG